MSETSLLWLVSISTPFAHSPEEMDSLDDDENLDPILCLALQQIVKPVSLIARPTQVELRRNPPVMNVDAVFGHVYCSAKVPEVVSLHSPVLISY